MALIEHTLLGTWEIISCTFEGAKETSGLEGIKFRLDDNCDITWYNDLVNPLMEARDCSCCCDSANVLFTCETYEINNESQPQLIFGAFAGHSIEFNVGSLTPDDALVLSCENWYDLECRRLKDDQAVGQEKEFSFLECLNESYFSDVTITSSDSHEYRVHASILRLNGFDCSMYIRTASPSAIQQTALQQEDENTNQITNENLKASESNHITISITVPNDANTAMHLNVNEELSFRKLSSMYLKLPSSYRATEQCNNTKLSSSYNCLLSNDLKDADSDATKQLDINNSSNRLSRITPNYHSDSHLDVKKYQHTSGHQTKNVFNFCPNIWQQLSVLEHYNAPNSVCSSRHPPLSPFRAKSPVLFSTSAIDTPPSSPLTPVGVLYDLPAFLLTPIIHWLYSESVLFDIDESVCDKLINFAESQPSLTRMADSFKKYSKLIALKKFVISIIMSLHNLLNSAIQSIHPQRVSFVPLDLYNTFKNCIRDCCLGCAKILQFCNIFVKDEADLTRYQKNEIIKYVRSRIPVFISQLHQLLHNVLQVLLYLTPEAKSNLAYFLIPKVENVLATLTNLMEEIKNSLENMCKNLKCSHLQMSDSSRNKGSNTDITSRIAAFDDPVALNDIFEQRSVSRQNSGRRGVENDLKFVLYMFELRKMRDIYGRISAVLDIIRDKRNTFIGLDYLTKYGIILDNISNLISYIPDYMSVLQMMADRVENALDWKEFKFCFKLVTSQINGVLVKIIDHKMALHDALMQICKLVEKGEFIESLIDLGLLEQSNILARENGQSENVILTDTEYTKVKLNLVRHLCEPPTAARSNLCKNALRLLHSAQLTDMEFVVHTVVDNSNNSVMTPHNKEFDVFDLHMKSSNTQVHVFRAHRVIVASRCDYFKKVLMSGMQESITRKINVTDTSPVIFRRLLLYLYGAPIDKTVGAEQICELMLLADRYSVIDLKELCENTLNALIDEHSVLCLLGIADHYMATALKTKCLSFIAQNSHITKFVLFKDLPQTLQLEVMDLIQWYGRVAEPWSDIPGFTSKSTLRSPTRSKIRSRKLSPC